MTGSRPSPRLLAVAATALAVAATACDSTTLEPIAEREYTGTLKVTGIERRFLVHLPPSHDGADPSPLVIALHPVPGTGQLMRSTSVLDEVGDRHGAVVVFPDAVWGEWAVGLYDPDLEYKPERDLELMSALIDDLDGHFNIDRSRVYATGYSNGALMAFRLACELAQQVTAVAPVAATMLTSQIAHCAPSRPVPILIMHGSEDREFPPQGRVSPTAESVSIETTVATWVEANGCAASPTVTALPDTADDGTTVRLDEYQGCREGASVQYYAIDGGGHTWPGSPSAVPDPDDRTSRELVASEVVAEFLLQFSSR